MSLTLDTVLHRIKQYEEEIVKVVANHASLVGALNELKQLLTLSAEPSSDAEIIEAE